MRVSALASAKPIENFAEVDHTVVNRGPSIDWVERAAGPLTRARLEDVSQRLGVGRAATGPLPAADEKSAATPEPKWAPQAAEFRKTTESEAAKARTIMQQKQAPPDVIPRILLTDAPLRPATPAPARGWRPAKRDTTH